MRAHVNPVFKLQKNAPARANFLLVKSGRGILRLVHTSGSRRECVVSMLPEREISSVEMERNQMVKTLAAAGVLAIAGSAVAAPFSIGGVTTNASTTTGFQSTGILSLIAAGGVFWNANVTAAAAADIPTSTLVGLNPDEAPAPGTSPLSTTQVGATPVIVSEAFTGAGDNAFSVSYGLSLGFVSAERFWIGQYLTDGELSLELQLATGDPFPTVVTLADGGFDPISGQDLEIVSEDGTNYFLQVVPAPGAMALMGLAGFAGLRRRRA